MELNWLESILYSLVSGLAQFLPVSARAHEAVLLRLFGSERSGWLDLMIHGAVMAALIVNVRPMVNKLRITRKILSIPKRRRRRQPDSQSVCDLRLVKTAFWPLILSIVLLFLTRSWESNLLILSGLLILNGLILYIPLHLPLGNKDSRSMSAMDSFLIGLGNAVGAVPGISRVGTGTSSAVSRGAEPQQALNWSLVLSIPALVLLIVFDVYSIFTQGFSGMTFLRFLQFAISSAGAFGSAYFAVVAVRFLSVRLGFSGFAYYSWGLALLIFILYLLI